MKKIMTALLAFSVITLANAKGNGGSNGMPLKPCYVQGEMQGVLMDYYQCRALGGAHNK